MTSHALVSRSHVAPGPRGTPILGNLRELRRDPLGLFLKTAIDFGGLARIRVAHLDVYLVSEPALIKHVLVDNMRSYVKGVSYESLRFVLGNGLLTAEGDLWRRQRRLMNGAFSRQALMDKVPTLVGCAASVCDRWEARAESGEPFDLVPEMMRLAFDVVGQTIFGTDIAAQMDEVDRALPTISAWIYGRTRSPVNVPPAIPTPGNLRYRRAAAILDRVVESVIDARRQGAPRGDLLSTLMNARYEDTGRSMSDRQLRDEVLTLLLAGHETTGSALCWAFHFLADHPTALARLHEELDGVLGGRAPTADDLPLLEYTGRVIDEAIRLLPPAWSFTRAAVQDDVLGTFLVPRGAMMIISPYVNHRHPAYWTNPDVFDPDRFEEGRAKAIEKYHYFPFGGGPHMCIGKHLTLFETKVTLALLAQRYRVVRAGDGALTLDPNISLRPGAPIPVRVERRHARRLP